MPRTSQEAIDRRNQKRREKRAAARGDRPKRPEPVLSSHKITARRMMPRLPESTSKADLRAMLAQAVQNTGRG